jgi:hypothetical protein
MVGFRINGAEPEASATKDLVVFLISSSTHRFWIDSEALNNLDIWQGSLDRQSPTLDNTAQILLTYKFMFRLLEPIIFEWVDTKNALDRATTRSTLHFMWAANSVVIKLH